MPVTGRHSDERERVHKKRALDANFNNSSVGALSIGRTYYQSPSPCLDCGSTFFWSHTKHCMHCSPHDADRLGIDIPNIQAKK